MIEDLLDMSRIMAGHLKISTRPTLLQPLLEFVVRSLEPAATAKQIAVQTHADPSIGPVGVDPDRLQQIAWHLVSNAIKFTPAGGRVVVSLGRRESEICLSVSDNGAGFDKDAGPLLFERFRQADSSSTRSYGGLGLGLGIVRHLVELHGGTVAARSEGLTRGSTFEVCLPMLTASEYSPEPHPPVEPEPLLRGISVLVVDDDPSAREFVRLSLEHFGALVRTAASAAEARDRFDRAPPDVLLSDIRMPDEDGIALIHDIREIDRRRGRHTPAAAFTALVRTEDRRRALEAGYQMHVASRSTRSSSPSPWSSSPAPTEPARNAQGPGDVLAGLIMKMAAESRHRCTVLIVEDEGETQDVLRAALESEGYVVRVAGTGRDALKYLRSTADTCMIVLDLTLPGIGARRLREVQMRDRALAWIPVVVVSGGVEAAYEARELGARFFVRQPVDLDELRTTLTRVRCVRAEESSEQRSSQDRAR
jgi:CheY-like chemotaxis protein/two-component sensor histidine kinase